MPDVSPRDLPDYPALSQLASALWNDNSARGAAILVGAGFSRNAILAGNDTKKPPLWNDLKKAMVEALYPDHPEDAPTDALRLAEEYRVYYGQSELNSFIRRQIPDKSWQPSDLHRELMRLPWADVLTTNYDTLLERASNKHKTVVDAVDLSVSRGARIIKLHGSIDSNARLVLSEEDYRNYPHDSAAFVNTARQVFLENELCLLGFSGDDPNFLQWSGWVRDHLGGGARRIYLVGSLGLSPAKRRMLENRNVSPIDFSHITRGMTREAAERYASSKFIEFLHSMKPDSPDEWQPHSSDSYKVFDAARLALFKSPPENGVSVATLRQLSAIWQSDMQKCPEWIVVPKNKRESVRYGTMMAPPGYFRFVGNLARPEKLDFLDSIVWRKQIALSPISTEILSECIREIELSERHKFGKLEKLARAVLREARLRQDKALFESAAAYLRSHADQGSDAIAEVVAQDLLWARDEMNLDAVSANVASLTGPNPMWQVLRAALHCECGELEEAKKAISDAMIEIADRQRRDPKSVWVASRYAWVDYIARALRVSEKWEWTSQKNYSEAELNYSPSEEVDRIRHEIRHSKLKTIEAPQGIQPKFGPGGYFDHSATIHFRSEEAGHEGDMVFRLMDTACIPLRVGIVDIFGSLAQDALDNEPLHNYMWYLRLLRAVKDHSSPLIEKHFGVISIANLSSEVASKLIERVFAACHFWLIRSRPSSGRTSSFAVERLRLNLEVLSRLVARSDAKSAESVFRWGCELAVDPRSIHRWLHEPLGNLLDRSLAALPPNVRGSLAIECLDFPLPAPSDSATDPWPEPVAVLFRHMTTPDRPMTDARWRACVAKLLAAVQGEGGQRRSAVHRLAYLHTFGALTTSEREEFGNLLWSSIDPEHGDLPRDVDLYAGWILKLPEKQGVNASELVKSYLFNTPIALGNIGNILPHIINAADVNGKGGHLLPTRDQALKLIDSLEIFVASLSQTDDPIQMQYHRYFLELVGRTVGWAILPQLTADDFSETRLKFVWSLAEPGMGGGVLGGLHEIARVDPESTQMVSAELRRAIVRGEIRDVAGAARAIVGWASGTKERYAALPGSLKDALVYALEGGVRVGLHSRLRAARRLVQLAAFSKAQLTELTTVVNAVRAELSYDKMPREGGEAIAITLVRAECIKLTRALVQVGCQDAKWEIDIERDPLPEVRFLEYQNE